MICIGGVVCRQPAPAPQPSLRHYMRARELKAAGMDWTEVLAAEGGHPRARLVAELLATPPTTAPPSGAGVHRARRRVPGDVLQLPAGLVGGNRAAAVSDAGSEGGETRNLLCRAIKPPV